MPMLMETLQTRLAFEKFAELVERRRHEVTQSEEARMAEATCSRAAAPSEPERPEVDWRGAGSGHCGAPERGRRARCAL